MVNHAARTQHDFVFPKGAPKVLRRKLSLTLNGEAIELRYRRSRWNNISESGIVQQRKTSGLIVVDGSHAGSFSVVETRADLFVDRHEFFDAMDELSEETASLGTLILEHWREPDDVFVYGDVVELRRLWMSPRLSGCGRLNASMSTLLASEFADRSILVLKAFPLEYEGDEMKEGRQAFEHRQAAMMRHYTHLLGVVPFPDWAGREGWMYAIPERLARSVAKPDFVSADGVLNAYTD
jgi:hypothetical protein